MPCRRCAKCCSLDVPLTFDELENAIGGAHSWRPDPDGVDYGLLKKNSRGKCVHLKGRHCTIYARRPQACRDWRCDRSLA